jgi:hypothetical protein
LVGQRVRAVRAYAWNGRLWVLLDHPDGAPARVRAEDTDLVDPVAAEGDRPGVVLSFAGIRRLRDLLVGLGATKEDSGAGACRGAHRR